LQFSIFCSSGLNRKRPKQHKQLLAAIKKGDRIVTSGGLHGLVTGLTDDVVTVEIAPKVRVKIARGSISGVATKAQQ
jgi:preprotein translocase subunit YajC